MAIKTNTFITPSAVGNREQLADFISNISPKETPFMSSVAKKGKPAMGVFDEWQQDSLAAAAQNKQIQGNDYDSGTLTAVVPTVRVGNYTQISSKTLIVSRTQDKAQKAGRGKEVAYQEVKAMAELKRDMEFGFLGNYAAVAPASGTAPVSAGLKAWLKTNTVFESAGSDPSYTTIPNDPRDAGTADAFAEADVKEVMREIWTSGGNASVALMGAVQKVAFSAFTGIAEIRKDAPGTKQATIMGAADVYVSDFGTVTVVPDRFCPADCAYFLDPDFWEIGYFDEPKWDDLAKTGDATKRLLVTEYVLRAKNEASSGIVTDLT